MTRSEVVVSWDTLAKSSQMSFALDARFHLDDSSCLRKKVGPHHETERKRTLHETEESEVPTWALNLFMKHFETWMATFFPILEGMMHCHATHCLLEETTK